MLTPFLLGGSKDSYNDKLEELPSVANFVVGVSAADDGSSGISFTAVNIFGYLETDKFFLPRPYSKIVSSPPS